MLNILFIIYLNDLPESIANVTKLYAILQTNSLAMQYDLDQFAKWYEIWTMKLNIKKCKVMHIGKHNKRLTYNHKSSDRTRHELEVVESEIDLGVVLSSNLKWHDQIVKIVSQASKMIYMLFNALKSREKDLVLSLYKIYIRPQVEFAQSVWSPYLKKNQDKLESVQLKITRLIDPVRNLDYQDRLNHLGLTTLEARRQRGDLIQTFKVLRCYEKAEFNTPIELTPSLNQAGPASNSRGHKLRIEQELVKNCEQRKQFHLNRIQNAWNNLPNDFVQAPSVNSFKAKLDERFQAKKSLKVIDAISFTFTLIMFL
jgi:ribonuclease P/MRP protein subunit RPP40